MNPHEEAVIRAFIISPRRPKWRESFSQTKRRGRFLDRLNHCQDLDDRFVTPVASNIDVASLLRARGAPDVCFVISATESLDGREMLLEDAIAGATSAGWGTIISCVPGKLAYYYDECGERRLLLQNESPG